MNNRIDAPGTLGPVTITDECSNCGQEGPTYDRRGLPLCEACVRLCDADMADQGRDRDN